MSQWCDNRCIWTRCIGDGEEQVFGRCFKRHSGSCACYRTSRVLGDRCELVGPLFAFGGMLSLASLDGSKSSVVGGCKVREYEEVADDDMQMSR